MTVSIHIVENLVKQRAQELLQQAHTVRQIKAAQQQVFAKAATLRPQNC